MGSPPVAVRKIEACAGCLYNFVQVTEEPGKVVAATDA